ncbi:unnamed protein product [Durusdinium trenchii]|uniref:Uncharacterized protein n=2 Tax=Durusdinium trenchii TaxID=1381693 RepID=A0ABP0HU32_9DINO
MGEVVRVPTDKLMEEQRNGAPVVLCMWLCVPACCCFWIPMLFFMGAANALPICPNYDSFTIWMKTYGLAPTLCAIAVQFLVTLTACCRNHCLFKLALRLQVLTGLVGVGLMAWGWVEYSQTEETPCVGTGDINPRTLALVFLIFGSIGAPGVLTAALMRGCCGDVNERKMVNGSDTGVMP